MLAATVALAPDVAAAQAYQCRVPQGPVSVPAIERDGPVRRAQVTGYTLAHEWAKHGSCMARTPEGYFKATRILWNSLRWPDFDRIARNDALTAGQVRKAFADANRHWEPAHVGLVVNERGWLEEMRLCYGKDFMPAPCDRRRFGPDDSAPVKIWRGL